MKMRVMMLLGVALLVCGVSGLWGMGSSKTSAGKTPDQTDQTNQGDPKEEERGAPPKEEEVKDSGFSKFMRKISAPFTGPKRSDYQDLTPQKQGVDTKTQGIWGERLSKAGIDISGWASKKKQAATDFKDYVRLKTGMMSLKEAKGFQKKQVDKKQEGLQRKQVGLERSAEEIERDFKKATDTAVEALADARAAKKAFEDLPKPDDDNFFGKQAYDMLEKSVNAKLKKAEQDAEGVGLRLDFKDKDQESLQKDFETLGKEIERLKGEDIDDSTKEKLQNLQNLQNQISGEIRIKIGQLGQAEAAQKEMEKSLKNYTNLVKVGAVSGAVIFAPVTLAVAGGMGVKEGIKHLKDKFPEIKKPGLTNLRVQIASFGDRVKESRATKQAVAREMDRVLAETQKMRSAENIEKYEAQLKELEGKIREQNQDFSINDYKNLTDNDREQIKGAMKALPEEGQRAFGRALKNLASAVKIQEESDKKLADLQKKTEDEAKEAPIVKDSVEDNLKLAQDLEDGIMSLNRKISKMNMDQGSLTAESVSDAKLQVSNLKEKAKVVDSPELNEAIRKSEEILNELENKLSDEEKKEITDLENEVAEGADKFSIIATMVSAGKKVMGVPSALVNRLRGKSKAQPEEDATGERTLDDADAPRGGDDDAPDVGRAPEQDVALAREVPQDVSQEGEQKDESGTTTSEDAPGASTTGETPQPGRLTRIGRAITGIPGRLADMMPGGKKTPAKEAQEQNLDAKDAESLKENERVDEDDSPEQGEVKGLTRRQKLQQDITYRIAKMSEGTTKSILTMKNALGRLVDNVTRPLRARTSDEVKKVQERGNLTVQLARGEEAVKKAQEELDKVENNAKESIGMYKDMSVAELKKASNDSRLSSDQANYVVRLASIREMTRENEDIDMQINPGKVPEIMNARVKEDVEAFSRILSDDKFTLEEKAAAFIAARDTLKAAEDMLKNEDGTPKDDASKNALDEITEQGVKLEGFLGANLDLKKEVEEQEKSVADKFKEIVKNVAPDVSLPSGSFRLPSLPSLPKPSIPGRLKREKGSAEKDGPNFVSTGTEDQILGNNFTKAPQPLQPPSASQQAGDQQQESITPTDSTSSRVVDADKESQTPPQELVAKVEATTSKSSSSLPAEPLSPPPPLIVPPKPTQKVDTNTSPKN